MNRSPASRVLRRAAALALLGALPPPCLAPSAQGAAPLLRRKAPILEAGTGSAGSERPLRSADGQRIGTWTASADAVRLRPRTGAEVVAPRLQQWLGSPDGRTLVGAGDPTAPEHPFELELAVFRDGRRVAALTQRFAPESAFTVGASGVMAVAGHAPDERGRPFALVLGAEGELLYRHDLPAGTLARDPVLLGERLLVRVHGVLDEGVGGAIHELDASGARLLVDAPGALALVGFPAAGRALVLGRAALTWIDAADGRVLWQRAGVLRPAGTHAWELWSSPAGAVLAVVTAEVRRAGGPARAPELVLLDATDGTRLASAALGAVDAPSEVDVLGLADELVVDWVGTREVFTWSR